MSTTYGIELEFVVLATLSKATVARKLSELTGLPVKDSFRGARTPNAWKVVQDASLYAPSGYAGLEVVSPVLENLNDGQIDKICRALSQIGATVNRSCGTHVHIGAGRLALGAMKRLAILYAESEDLLDALLPPSRRGNTNQFCRSVKANMRLQGVLDAQRVADLAQAVLPNHGSEPRYTKLNFTAYWRHGTVEFRQHSGTIDPEKIKNWALLCNHLVTTARRTADTVAGPQTQGSTNDVVYNSNYWRKGKRRRKLLQMLLRPEGVTVAELQEALGLRARPSIMYQVANASDLNTFRPTAETRFGLPVWKQVSTTTPTTGRALGVTSPGARPAPTHLDGLLTLLNVPASERTYWVERAALLNEPA